jgi:hypothetical protein
MALPVLVKRSMESLDILGPWAWATGSKASWEDTTIPASIVKTADHAGLKHNFFADIYCFLLYEKFTDLRLFSF